jgi:hypothetical protein
MDDGDGIPDDVELANGLDPNDPVDAHEDLDADGLTNAEELLTYGTGLRDPDSDDDGIKDGEETGAGGDGFVTNPLAADTDGDGVRDGLEVATGDPTDPAQHNLAGALSRSASTRRACLTVNAVSEASPARRHRAPEGRHDARFDVDEPRHRYLSASPWCAPSARPTGAACQRRRVRSPSERGLHDPGGDRHDVHADALVLAIHGFANAVAVGGASPTWPRARPACRSST